nr:MAG TPA: hypothetical protein [Caudoviricetes sp.]
MEVESNAFFSVLFSITRIASECSRIQFRY